MRPVHLLLITFFPLLTGCSGSDQQNKKDITASTELRQEGHPTWVMQGNIYEVNIRQYTPAGTFKAFETHLERLKAMGVQTLWFMPIHPISEKDRKGKLGSYYAVSSYYTVNPEFGDLEDWKSLVHKAKQAGFRILMDWVPNHTGADHDWITAHPDFYVMDSVTHQPLAPFDWSDVRELNYDNRVLRDSMIAAMSYWLQTVPIDGFRVDVAWGVPDDFWKECIPSLQKIRPSLFMLAEAEGPQFHAAGFDATYPWKIFHTMNDIAAGKKNVTSLDSVIAEMDSTYPANALQLYFTSNHDENSWNKAEYGTMPGAAHAPFAVFTQLYSRSVPLVYSGQEEPVTDSISFFYKDTIQFQHRSREKFYSTLLQLRKEHPALKATVPAQRISLGDARHIFAFSREAAGKKILVILNLSPDSQLFVANGIGKGKRAVNVFDQKDQTEDAASLTLGPWAYKVYKID